MPRVSIIVPVYKVEIFLRDCVESILQQTYQDYEVILVDDGSPDCCGQICDMYAQKDNRIRVIHKANGGLSSARNAGLDVAVGKYICFLDSDDTIEPDLLQKAVMQMDIGQDMVVFNFFKLYDDGRKESCTWHTNGDYILENEEARKNFVLKVLLNGKIGWEAWSRMYDREKIEKYHLRFEDNKKIFAEDLYFCLCYCVHAERIRSIEDSLYNYRIREDSIMGVQNKKINVGRINELSKAVLAFYRQFDDCRMLVDDFDIAHMKIIMGQFIPQLWKSELKPEVYRDAVWESITDSDFMKYQMNKVISRKNLLWQMGSVEYAMELLSHAKFLMGGSWQVLRIRCKMIRMFHPVIAWYDIKKGFQ